MSKVMLSQVTLGQDSGPLGPAPTPRAADRRDARVPGAAGLDTLRRANSHSGIRCRDYENAAASMSGPFEGAAGVPTGTEKRPKSPRTYYQDGDRPKPPRCAAGMPTGCVEERRNRRTGTTKHRWAPSQLTAVDQMVFGRDLGSTTYAAFEDMFEKTYGGAAGKSTFIHDRTPPAAPAATQ